MFVEETGAAPAPVVLLLHALGLDHSMWGSQAAALRDCRVLAPDLPGFGRSRREPCGIELAVAACARTLDTAGGMAVVVGLSYGGYVAARLAAEHPQLVSGLALSGVRRQVPRLGARLQAGAFRLTRARSLARGEAVPTAQLAYEKRNLIAASDELGAIDLRASLPRITAPTVVFAPSRDRFVRAEVPHVATAIASARVETLPGLGHLWPVAHPGPLTDAVRALLATQR